MMKHVYRVIKKPFFGRFEVPWRWPEQANQEEWERVEFKSHVDSPMSGLIGHAKGEVKGAILLAHPMGVSAKGFWIRYGHAEILRQAGYHVMVFDINGFGESESTHMEYPLDVLQAGLFLQSQFPDLNIGVIGASLGGAATVCALAQASHPFKSAVIESAFPTLLDFWSIYLIPKLALKLTMILYPSGEKRMRPILSAENLQHQPDMLLIYGSSDKFTTVEQGQRLFNVLTDKTKVDFWIAEGAEHTHALKAQPDLYAERVVRFFNDSLTASDKPEMAANAS